MIKGILTGTALATSLLLAGCGGSSAVNSTPTPSPTPSPTPAPTPTPTPTPTSSVPAIIDPSISHAYNTTAAVTQFTATTPDGIVQSTAQSTAALAIHYDAASQTYSVSAAGDAVSFGQSERLADRFAGEIQYAKADGSSYLTIDIQPYHGMLGPNSYVALGYWQNNSLSTGLQQTHFDSFVFGSLTPDAAMPRAGTAHWLTDIFGLYLTPGDELRIISAAGDFDVDFSANAYVAKAFVTQDDYITGGGVTGALYFQSGGQISSNGSFSGPFTYGGTTGLLTGSMSGSFYGPNAQEVGGIFNASGTGGTLTGSFTGQQSTLTATSDGVEVVSLTAAAKTEILHDNNSAWLYYQSRDDVAGLSTASVLQTSAAAVITPTGVGEVDSTSYAYMPNAADRTANQRANFDTYAKTIAGNPTTISIYKIGSANSELALTYTSFFSWSSVQNSTAGNTQIVDANVYYVPFGIKTADNLMAARTGGAQYNGVAYGSAVDMAGLKYDITGTSRFDINFSAQTYSGALTLNAALSGGGSTQSLGAFNFASTLVSGNMLSADLPHGSNWGGSNSIQPQFYGPMGQEIGAAFQMVTGPNTDSHTLAIAGAALAKLP